jgi:type I restriction enzyme S subunit
MSENWVKFKLGDIALFKNGKSRPSNPGSYPVYGGNGILDYTDSFNSDGEVIIIGRVGAYCGNVFYENKPLWISDNAMFSLPQKLYSTRFLYYLLKNTNLNRYALGSSHPLLTQTLLNQIEVLFTTEKNQQEIIANNS